MNEGTKLSSKSDDQASSSFTNTEVELEETLSGTKIGEISDFEKSLYPTPKEEIKIQVPTIKKIESFNIETTEEQVQEKKEVAHVLEKPVETIEKKAKETKQQNDVFARQIENTVLDYKDGDLIKGIVRNIEKSGVLVDIKYKSDGFIPNNEFSQIPGETPQNSLKIGDEIDAFIVKLETKEGYSILSRKHAQYELAWNYLYKITKTKEVVEVQVTSKVEGGLVVEYQGIKGFIPASHVLKSSDEKLEQFLDKVLSVVVIQTERNRRKVIFSHKLARIRPEKADLEKALENIEVGEVKTGTVSSIKDFGVFVNLGGIEGLVHISELSWSRVNHPSELLKVGDKVNVFVLGVDRDTNKISLGMKQLQSDPWVEAAEKYKIGQIITGTVSRIVSFGAFVQVEKNLEGLIHISELSYQHVEKVEEVISVGMQVKAKIIKLLPDEQKIGLTLKGIDQNKEPEADKTEKTAKAEKTDEAIAAE